MKNIFLILLFFGSMFSFSQTRNSDCVFEYKTQIEDLDKVGNDYQMKLHWDFSKIDLNTTEVEIELIPILDCFNNENAQQFREAIVFTSKSKDFNEVSTILLSHLEMKAKCFKYRVKIKSDCETVSDWYYYNFIKF